jgi:hypothetical protein
MLYLDIISLIHDGLLVCDCYIYTLLSSFVDQELKRREEAAARGKSSFSLLTNS